jgi:hypothetical protein
LPRPDERRSPFETAPHAPSRPIASWAETSLVGLHRAQSPGVIFPSAGSSPTRPDDVAATLSMTTGTLKAGRCADLRRSRSSSSWNRRARGSVQRRFRFRRRQVRVRSSGTFSSVQRRERRTVAGGLGAGRPEAGTGRAGVEVGTVVRGSPCGRSVARRSDADLQRKRVDGVRCDRGLGSVRGAGEAGVRASRCLEQRKYGQRVGSNMIGPPCRRGEGLRGGDQQPERAVA